MPTPSPDLVFQHARLVGSPTHLVFGDTQGAAPPIEVSIAATLANTLTVAAIAGVPVKANITCNVGQHADGDSPRRI